MLEISATAEKWLSVDRHVDNNNYNNKQYKVCLENLTRVNEWVNECIATGVPKCALPSSISFQRLNDFGSRSDEIGVDEFQPANPNDPKCWRVESSFSFNSYNSFSSISTRS